MPQVSPAQKAEAEQRTPRLCIITGENNRDVTSNRLAKRDLEDAGYAALLREFKGMGHALPPRLEERFTEALQWMLDAPSMPPQRD